MFASTWQCHSSPLSSSRYAAAAALIACFMHVLAHFRIDTGLLCKTLFYISLIHTVLIDQSFRMRCHW